MICVLLVIVCVSVTCTKQYCDYLMSHLPVFDRHTSLFVLLAAMRETKEALESVSSSLEVLQEGTGKLRSSLSGERASLSNTLSDPACTNGAVSSTCNTIRSTLAQLAINADYSRVQRRLLKDDQQQTDVLTYLYTIFLTLSSPMSITPWLMSTPS